MTAYLYDEGYLRTSSTEYALSDDPAVLADTRIHLTNDAVQNQDADLYGKVRGWGVGREQVGISRSG